MRGKDTSPEPLSAARLWRVAAAPYRGGSIDAFFDALLRDVRDASVAIDRAWFWIVEDDVVRVRGAVGVPNGDAGRAALPLGRAVASRIVTAGAPRTLRDRSLASLPQRRALLAPDTREVYVAPLTDGDATLGVLCAAPRAARRLPSEDRVLLRMAAVRAATAIAQQQVTLARDDAEAARARADADRRRAFSVRDDLLAIVSHDLGNPLAAVAMNAAAIASLARAPRPRAGSRARIERATGAILAAVGQMQRLVGDLSDLARVEATGALPVDVRRCDGARIARDAVQMLEGLAKSHRLKLSAELPSAPCFVLADRARLLQIFSNLIGNAIKFTREGGSIEVRASRRGADVVFSVVDTGVGIDEEQRRHLFEPYWRGYRGRKGLGLGLSVVKAILDTHGGRIWVDTEVGAGSTFFFTLPAARAEARPRARRSTPRKRNELSHE